jgi:hypothetical protein
LFEIETLSQPASSGLLSLRNFQPLPSPNSGSAIAYDPVARDLSPHQSFSMLPVTLVLARDNADNYTCTVWHICVIAPSIKSGIQGVPLQNFYFVDQHSKFYFSSIYMCVLEVPYVQSFNGLPSQSCEVDDVIILTK